jgi:Rrf2 family protein
MLSLALRYGRGPVLLKDVAQAEGISEKYLSQIIIPLKAAGLVKSFRGPHGGYVLARAAKTITMKDIVEVLEGTTELVGYERNAPAPARVSVTVTRKLWRGLSEKISHSLAVISLADLVKECAELEEKSITYTI